MVHGAFLPAEDTRFVSKPSKKMPGVQRWKDYSGNPDRGGYIIGHNWSILGLLSPFSGRWLCFPIIAVRTISRCSLRLRKNAVGWDDYHMDAWLPIIISAKV
ncbi:hypothetical protein CW714_09765 [Methanophagales archaeon]|nr:MAG: hypothetical protein CW714_09765 [Methanophagales archaeon]